MTIPERGSVMKTANEIVRKTIRSIAESAQTSRQNPTGSCVSCANVVTLFEPLPPMKTNWQTKWLRMNTTGDKRLAEMADAAESFCGRWFKNNPTKSLLILSGDVRTGKTHVAKRVTAWAQATAFTAFCKGRWGRDSVPNVVYLSWPEVAAELNVKNRGPLEDAFKADLLILDDVGAENDPWKICEDAFCQVLSRREKKFTLITTNIPPNKWNVTWNVRVADRLVRNSVLVDLSAVKPYRQK